MKTNIIILKLEDWAFKNQQGNELSGTSAIYLLEDYEQHRTTLNDSQLQQLKNCPIPSIFEVDIKPVQRFNNGKSRLKYEILSLKHIKEVSLFNSTLGVK